MSIGKQVTWSQLPMGSPTGDLVPHMSARRRTQIADTVFEMVGGVDAMAAWVEQSDENRAKFYTQIWGRGQARVTQAPDGVGNADNIEELLARLDAGEHARVVGDGE